MPVVDATTRLERLRTIQALFWRWPGRGYKTSEVASILGVSERTARNYLNDFGRTGYLPLTKNRWYWTLSRSASFDLIPVKFNIGEATSLYIAARLLAKGSDEYNPHVYAALLKLVHRLPDRIAFNLRRTVETLAARAHALDTGTFKSVFETMAAGWVTQRVSRISYRGWNTDRASERLFHPYLMEPSAVGYTIYAIGHSEPPGALRTFKLERVEWAELTEDRFDPPEDFDGLALLDRAWGIMHGSGQTVTVKLRFTPEVTRRVKESVWHASQRIEDEPEGGGCILTVTVGYAIEIIPWIRGWGSACEVLEPASLRETMIAEAGKIAATYGLVVAGGGRGGGEAQDGGGRQSEDEAASM